MLAGPGTGKTHALVDLYEQAVRRGAAGREQILVLTFSTGAAGEIAGRIDERLNDDYGEAWISTFHSFCARLLREHAPDRDRLLLNGFQEWIVMRHVLSELEPEVLGPLEGVRRSDAFARDVLAFVSLMKQNLVHPSALQLAAEASAGDRLRVLASIYQAYQMRLREARLVDFRDLISGAIELLQSNPALREAMRAKFRYVLVDEFQDVDPAQFELLRLIAPPEANPRLVVVGDPDQSIYGFRGTVPRLLSHDFTAVYGSATLQLEESSPRIIRSPAASGRPTPVRSSGFAPSGQRSGWPISPSCFAAPRPSADRSKRPCGRSAFLVRCVDGAPPPATRSSAS